MSLKSTTSLHSMLAKLTNSAHQGAAQARILTKLQEEEDKVLVYNDYNLNENQVDYLAALGINSSPSGWRSHPHVIHKIIENFILFEHVKHLIKTDYVAAFMKREKFTKFSNMINHRGVLRNALVSDKDVARYGTGEVHPFLERIKAPTLFLHDSLHFETPYTIAKLFLDNPKLETIIATAVVPVETTYFGQSLYPELYSIQYVGNKILYIPEGHHANAYEQPRSAHWILSTRTIRITAVNGRQFTVSIKRLESIRAHHVFMITRKPVQVRDDYITFDSPKLATVPSIFPSFPLSRRIVPYDYLEKMIEYSKAVKTNAHTNLDCKNRFLMSQEKYPNVPQSTRFLVTHFSYAMTAERRKIELKSNISEGNPILRAIQTQFGPWINYGERKHLERFLSALDLKEFHYTFKLEDLDINQWELPTKVHWPGYSFKYVEDGENMIFERTTNEADALKAAMEVIDEIEKRDVNELFPMKQDTESEEDSFSDAPSVLPLTEATKETPLFITANAGPIYQDGNRCGLQVFVDHGFAPDDVERAYKSAKSQTRQQLPPSATPNSHPHFPNFLCTQQKFPWLSGTEVAAIGAVLGYQINLHTPAYCHLSPEPTALDVYHERSNHWTTHAHNSTPCKCT